MHEQIGFEKGICILAGLVHDNLITAAEAAKRAGLTEAEFEKYLKEYTEKAEQKPHSL